MDLSETLISEVEKRPALWNLKGKAYHNRLIVDRDWSKVAEITGLSVGAAKVRWKNLRDHFRKELLKQHRPNSEGAGEKRVSKWIHFDSLLFLKNVLRPRSSRGRLPPVCTNEDFSETNGAETEDAATNEDSGDYEISQPGNETGSGDERGQQTAMVPSRTETPTLGNAEDIENKRRCKREQESTDGGSPENPSVFEDRLLKIESEKHLSMLQSLEDDDLNFLKSLLPYMKTLPPIRKLVVRSQFQNLIVQEMISCQGNNTGALPNASDSGVQFSPGGLPSPDQD